MKKGFTLVELLVVIVIIAVLAAFGLPMYRTSVDEALGAEMLKMAQTVMGAQKEFAAKNGEGLYTLNPNVLNVTLKGTADKSKISLIHFNDFSLELQNEGVLSDPDGNKKNTTTKIKIKISHSGLEILLFTNAPQYPVCLALNGTEKERFEKVCLALGGRLRTASDTLVPNLSSYGTQYILP